MHHITFANLDLFSCCISDIKLRLYVSYMKCLADRSQLKIREGKTKRKKPTHIYSSGNNFE